MTSIGSSSPFAIPSLSASLTALATQKRLADTTTRGDTGQAALQPKQAKPFDITKTDTYALWKAEAAVAQDTQELANAVTAAFQSIIAQHPDLADATFEFTGGKDGIRVTSSAMKEEDRIWLEKQLNANGPLLDVLNRFNGDLGKMVDQAAALQAREAGLPPPAKTPISKIDNAIPILAMLQGVVSKAAPPDSSDGSTYTDRWGQPVDLSKARTNTLAGMIDAKRQLDALQDGSIVARLGNGRILYDSYINPDPYAAAASIAAAFVPTASASFSQAAMLRAATQQVDRRI